MPTPYRRIRGAASTQSMARAVVLTLAVLLVAATTDRGAARAQEIEYAFTDPVGDETGPIDVTSLVLIFFPSTGSYRLYMTADPAHPFAGKFRVNINLYNPDVDPQFAVFQHACSTKCEDFGGNTDFNFITSRTRIALTGHNAVLKHWSAGTRAVTSTNAGFGNPPDTTLFRSAVAGFPLTFETNEDCVACDGTGVAVGQLTIARRGWVLPTPLPTP